LSIQVNAQLSLGVDFDRVTLRVINPLTIMLVMYDGFCSDSSNTNFFSYDVVATNINTADDCVTECPTDNGHFNGFTWVLGPSLLKVYVYVTSVAQLQRTSITTTLLQLER
jgi:hypothetical protein